VEGSDPRGTGARFGRGAGFACAPPSPPPAGVATLEIIPAGRRRSPPSPSSDDGAGRRPAAVPLPRRLAGSDVVPDWGFGAVKVGRMWHAGAVVVLGVAGLPLIVWALRFGEPAVSGGDPASAERGEVAELPPGTGALIDLAAYISEAGSRFAREDMRAETDGRGRQEVPHGGDRPVGALRRDVDVQRAAHEATLRLGPHRASRLVERADERHGRSERGRGRQPEPLSGLRRTHLRAGFPVRGGTHAALLGAHVGDPRPPGEMYAVDH